MTLRRALFLPLITLVGLVGCDKADDSGDTAAAVTYADIAPIMEAHCTSCHVDGGSAPFALDNYADASSRAERLVVRAVEDSDNPMPPSGLALSESEADLLTAWADAGAPEAR